jgi:hypothetical protein
MIKANRAGQFRGIRTEVFQEQDQALFRLERFAQMRRGAS